MRARHPGRAPFPEKSYPSPVSREDVHRSHIASVLALCLVTALAPLTAAEDAAAPVLVEIQPDPEGTDRGNEWIELANPTPVPLPVDGLYVTDHDPCFLPGEGFVSDHAHPLEGTIPAGGHLVITLPSACVNLANSGDDLALVTEDGTELQSVSYGDQGGQPTPSDGESLSACHLAANLHGAWSTAAETKGSTNPTCATV